MNDRIKEIAKQADISIDGMGFGEGDVESFAKLIIQECCNMFVDLRSRPADLAVKDIKKHFGI